MARTLSERQQKALQKAFGAARVLSVGVSNYPPASGYSQLAACANDANAVADCFADVPELNAARGGVVRLTSKTTDRPTRGALLGKVRDLAEQAAADERIFLYYSGHGQRLGDEFYLVPEDVVSVDEPDTLLPLSRVFKALGQSQARQKVVLLDACLSGPDTRDLKVPLANTSPKFLAEYIEHTTGVGVVASSNCTQVSWAKSPNPKLSLFTYFLVQALNGEPEALLGRLLTLDSLCQFLSVRVRQLSKDYGKIQVPTWKASSEGTIVVADFTKPVLPPAVDLESAPVSGIQFQEGEDGSVDQVLTAIKYWRKYSVEYLEKRVNANLGKYCEERFGEATPALCSEFGFDAGQVTAEGSTLLFPGGSYEVRYEADDLKTGSFVHTASFDPEWFDRAPDILKVIKLLGLYPQRMVFQPTRPIDVTKTLPGLRARGWSLTSILQTKIEAEHSGRFLTVEDDSVAFHGFTPQEILGSEGDEKQSRLVGGILLLLGGKTRRGPPAGCRHSSPCPSGRNSSSHA